MEEERAGEKNQQSSGHRGLITIYYSIIAIARGARLTEGSSTGAQASPRPATDKKEGGDGLWRRNGTHENEKEKERTTYGCASRTRTDNSRAAERPHSA